MNPFKAQSNDRLRSLVVVQRRSDIESSWELLAPAQDQRVQSLGRFD